MRNLHGMHKLFIGISKLWGVAQQSGLVKYGEQMQHVDSLSNAWIWVNDGIIERIGVVSELSHNTLDALNSMLPYGVQLSKELLKTKRFIRDSITVSQRFQLLEDFPGIDFKEFVFCGNREILPGFVDSHTHIVFAEPRTEEFKLRIQGAGYEAIAASGGGILNSAKKLQLLDFDTLLFQARKRLDWMVQHGTTTVEIKSGYGLTVESELTMLRVIAALKKEFPGIIKATFLGAHAFPMEFKGREEDYVKLVIDDMLPRVAEEGLADHVDVFCDRGFFTAEQTSRILKAAAAFGLPAKIHANELGITGGVQVAVSHGAWSADHLEYLGDAEIALFAESLKADGGETVPVALPGCSYFLGIPYANVRALMNAGLPVALATDFNPGSSPVCSLQQVWSLACTQQKMLPVEGFNAITCNAARALRLEHQVGSIASGMHANFIVTTTENAMDTVPYFFGKNHIDAVYIKGNSYFGN